MRPDGSFGRRPDLTAPVVFPHTALAARRAASVERAVPWHGAAAYIGAFAALPGGALTRGLYIADDLTPGRVRTRRVALPRGAMAWDLLVDGDRLRVLFAVPGGAVNGGGSAAAVGGEGAWRSVVWATSDGTHWTQEAAFSAVTFARSFARLGDFYYFGLGSLGHPGTPGATPADRATGTLLRLPAAKGTAGTTTGG